MAIGFSLEAEPYVPKEDRALPEAEQTEFLLTNLTHQQWEELMSGRESGGELVIGKDYGATLLKRHLAGWRNFKTRAGADIPFTESQDDNLDRIPAGLRMELVLELIARNRITEEERKN